jgi:hypothetical protein
MLCDLVVVSHSASPYQAHADFHEHMSDVFDRCSNSMLVGSTILRDDALFQVFRVWVE